eukprot:scaffold8315_cov54-Phaeocystis_antarctica.AAC.2
MVDLRVGGPGAGRTLLSAEPWLGGRGGTRGSEARPSPSSTCRFRAMFRSRCCSYSDNDSGGEPDAADASGEGPDDDAAA